MMNQNDYIKQLEKEIYVLKQRVAKLERIEKRRKIKATINILIKIIILIAAIISLYKSYININEKYIKPYMKTINEVKEKYDEISNNKILNWKTNSEKEENS